MSIRLITRRSIAQDNVVCYESMDKTSTGCFYSTNCVPQISGTPFAMFEFSIWHFQLWDRLDEMYQEQAVYDIIKLTRLLGVLQALRVNTYVSVPLR